MSDTIQIKDVEFHSAIFCDGRYGILWDVNDEYAEDIRQEDEEDLDIYVVRFPDGDRVCFRGEDEVNVIYDSALDMAEELSRLLELQRSGVMQIWDEEEDD